MPRKPTPPRAPGEDWFLVEWMRSKQMSQAELGRRTGWSKATTNDIVHGRTSYYRQMLNEAAAALEIYPFELLLSPAEANHIRSLRETAVRLAAEERKEWHSSGGNDEKRLVPAVRRTG